MHQAARPWLWSVVVVALLTAIGCTGSPSSPSGLSGSGASISGRISGFRALSDAQSIAAISHPAASSVTVTVEGTGITTTVDGNGEFTLTNVPAGTVRIQFTGPGTNATVTLSGVNNGDHIDITVSLNGKDARVESQDMESEGKVTNLSASPCPNLTFAVNSRTIHTNSATKFEEGSCSAIKNDVKVEVKGTRQSDGSIMATKVELGDNDD